MISKICPICQVEKPIDQYTKATTNSDGLATYCRECYNAKNRAWKKNNKHKIKNYRQEHKIEHNLSANKRNCKKHGWVPPNFNGDVVRVAIEQQNGLCAACRQSFGNDSYYIDHDHKTGNFRGLLCAMCNWAEGMLKTSENCLRMAAYLKKFE